MANSLKIGFAGKVLSFGELLLRISPDQSGNWLKQNTLPFYIAGAELNVSSALAVWNIPTKYITALPDNGLTRQLISYLERQKIDMSSVIYQGDRLGLYYLTKGKDLKNDALIYDRANSAFSELKPGIIDWDKELDGVCWFHFSAICPAISQNIADVCKEALIAAAQRNITISVDLNYRSKLWQYGKAPGNVMPDLIEYCDVIMGNIWAADTMLNIPIVPDIHESGQKSIYLKEASKTSEEILRRYPKCKAVANTFRFDEQDKVHYYCTLAIADRFYTSNEYSTTDIINKVGSGDCFMAGLIYGFYNNFDSKQVLEFAAIAAFEKLFIESDFTTTSAEKLLLKMNKWPG